MLFYSVIFCDDGKFITQSARDHGWLTFFQVPEEARPNIINGVGSRAFKFFKRVNNGDQAIMMVGLKFYIVDFIIDSMELQIRKELDLRYLSEKFPSTDFSRVRDIQVLDDKKSYGFLSWKSAIAINNQAFIEFFIYDGAKL